jgi:aryl-alcohol dehydrogenase-like predicted oxidoreductase
MTRSSHSINRRNFLRLGMMTAGGAAITSSAAEAPAVTESVSEMKYRPLGKTGLNASEISFGTYGFNNPALLTAALDAGINLICTCGDYQDGQAERSIGEAIGKLGERRDDLIIMTGTKVGHGATKESILAAIDSSLMRLQTDHVEIFRTHNVGEPEDLQVAELFEAFEAARKAGKAMHLGLSGHKGGLQGCLNAAIDDGRFEVFLCKYDFASYEDQEAIIKRAAAAGVGTIAFKTNAGARQKEIKDLEAGGLSLDQAAAKWALSNPNVASVCAGITNFDQIREFCGAVGKKLTEEENAMLRRYADAVRERYCRFCAVCEESCPHHVAVADINRYAMYFKYYGREKDSMQLYSGLSRHESAAQCSRCEGRCEGNCPFGRRIKESLIEAHEMLSFA